VGTHTGVSQGQTQDTPVRGNQFIRLPGRRLKAGPGAADTARNTAAAAAVADSRVGHDGTTQRRVLAASNEDKTETRF
jgi:hypothetical protein